jgi:hypothetical protein
MRNETAEPSSRKQRRDPPQMAVPWGRGASEYRPGRFTKQYFEKHGEACCADVFTALREVLKRVNKERVEISEKPIRGCTYNSFAKYWHWFKLFGLIEPVNKTKPSIYDFLEQKVFYRLTDKGWGEVRAWEDPRFQ